MSDSAPPVDQYGRPFDATLTPSVEMKPIAAAAVSASVATRDLHIEIFQSATAETHPTPKSPLRSPKVRTIIPVDVTWKSVNYSVQIGKKQPPKQIIKDVSGFTRSGQMCAIMGSSGAGKSTLLDILSRRIGSHEGSVLFNDTSLGFDDVRKIAGYVTQQDILTETMTVQETLSFFAALKLPRSYTVEERNARVEEIIDSLGLRKAANTFVGGVFLRGISGGERRRVSIGIELITEPSVIFLDEPTSGLDSHTSLSLTYTLRRLARNGNTIIATIHQPRFDIFDKFDNLLLLADGETVYFGPTKGVVNHFARLGYKCPDDVNPADYVIDLTTHSSEVLEDIPELSRDQVKDMCQKYRESDLCRKNLEEVEKPTANSSAKTASSMRNDDKPYFWTQVQQLMWRNTLESLRNPLENRAKISTAIFQGFLIGIIFLQLDLDQSGARGRLGCVIFAGTTITFAVVGGVVQAFPLERQLVNHERKSNCYSIEAYYTARMITDRPMLLLIPLLFSIVCYFMVDLRSGGEYFGKFLLVMIIMHSIAQSLGLTISAFSPNVALASIFGPLTVVVFLLFSGFYVGYKDIPIFLRWMTKVSIIRWGYQALALNEFEGVEFTCDESELVIKDPTKPAECPIRYGEDILDTYELGDGDYWDCVYILLGMFGVLSILLYLALKIQDRKAQSRR